MKRCIELLRVSTLGQADADRASLPSQRAINRQTADRYGLTIVRSIEMAGVSGAAVLLAPEIQEMLRLMKDREIHGVIAREFSRLMRPENFADYGLLQSFVDSNTVLYLPEGPIDFSSDSGMILGTVQATLGGIERKQMKKKIWSAKEIKRRKGELAQSRICLPYGVTYPWAYTADAEKVREVFRMFLSGQTRYGSLALILGVTVPGLRCIMRNPIYTGWRVIDTKRDASAAGLYPSKDGRQVDRRKIKREPDEVIRIKVIDEPLISESEFNHVQRLMDLKQKNSWRHNPGFEHRFAYNGYLNCVCGSLIYTKYRRGDYYICRDRCGARYMRRDRLEPCLDQLFTKHLTKRAFLKQHILAPLTQKNKPQGNSALLRTQLESLEAKKTRILDAFFEGVIQGDERERRVKDVESERLVIQEMLARHTPVTGLTLETLVEAFSPFTEFDLLNRDDKRRILNTIAPSIVVKDYEVSGMWVGLDCRDKESHTDKDSSRQRA